MHGLIFAQDLDEGSLLSNNWLTYVSTFNFTHHERQTQTRLLNILPAHAMSLRILFLPILDRVLEDKRLRKDNQISNTLLVVALGGFP